MERLFEYLTDLSGGLSYAVVFGILVACGLGFPLPEDIPLIATGYLIWDGTMRWVPATLLTLAGVLIGDTILFYIGRTVGNRIKAFFNPDKIQRTRAYFRKYGDKIVFFARFVAGFRAVAFFMAGAMHMPYRRFLLLDGLAALVSVPLWIVVGYLLGHYFGDEISRVLLGAKHLKNTFTLVVFIIVAVVAFRTYWKFRQAKKTKKAS